MLADGFGDILIPIERVALADNLHAPDMNQNSSEVNQNRASRILGIQILIRLGVNKVDDVQRDLEDGQEECNGCEGDIGDEQRPTVGPDAMEHHKDESKLEGKGGEQGGYVTGHVVVDGPFFRSLLGVFNLQGGGVGEKKGD